MSAWSFSEREGIGDLLFNKPGTEVNVLTSEHMRELDAKLDELSGKNLKALTISSGKSRIFIAGADIREIESIKTPEDAVAKADLGKAVFQKLEDLPYPTVCVINGACLGGGYELALSCTWRVASFSPSVKVGLPEVNLGILPGFGGSIRLPRLVGLLKGLPLILTGKMCSAEEALKNGMVDALFPEVTLAGEAFAFAKKAGEGRSRPKRKKTWQAFLLEDTPFRALVFSRARKDVLEKTKGHYPAPLWIIKLVSKTYGRRGKGVWKAESEHFAKLGATDTSKNLISTFFLTEKYKKVRWTKASISSDGVKKCGVIGAGVMGGGIAQLVSFRDIPVRIKDLNEKALGGALKEAMSLYQKAAARRKIKRHEVENKMDLISVGMTNDGLSNCDILIEAVVEDLGIKQKVFAELSSLTGPQTILASNTSSLPVTKMAEVCRHPERVVGMHFFNPVNRMPLVEVIRAGQSSEEALERTVLFSRRLGKTAIVVADRPGFLVNRLLLPYMNEAAFLLKEGWAPQDIDALVEAFGMPMGPVELVDQIGIDVGYKVAHILEEAFGERMKAAPIIGEAKENGLLGKKSKKGFYLYEEGRRTPNAALLSGPGSTRVSGDDALKRMLYVMINEASRCLEEKAVDSASTVDIGMLLGTGFPPFRGGLLRYADSVGAGAIAKDLERFRKDTGAKRFEPSPLLSSLASAGGRFHAS